ncbi:MAG: hypothetical protein NTU48_02915 [Legionellales bacterium]|nr:hypothetical protein [Legionellales bacterium]
MMKVSCAVCAVSLCTMLCACNHVLFQDTPDYADYNSGPQFGGIAYQYPYQPYPPGFTGYTVGYDGYGSYDDGFGPSYWEPRFNFYKNGLHGYRQYPY